MPTVSTDLGAIADELTQLVLKDDITDADLKHGQRLVLQAQAARLKSEGRPRPAWADQNPHSISPAIGGDGDGDRTPSGALKSLPGPGEHPWAKALMARAGGDAKAVLPAGQPLAVPVSPDIFAMGAVPTSVLSLVSTVNLGPGNTTGYFRQGTRTNNAAVVDHGALKPTSLLGLSRVEAAIVTIAHLSEPVARQDLDDLPGLSDWLQRELIYGLSRALESEIIGGVGTSADVDGILDVAGTFAIAYATSVLQTIRAAIAAVVGAGYAPSAVLLNPTDDAALDLSADTAGRFYSSPFDAGSPSVWGVRRVSSPEVPVGSAIVGDFRTGVRVGMRESAQVVATDAGPELFDHNLVKVRAELRAAVMVVAPAALAVADLTV